MAIKSTKELSATLQAWAVKETRVMQGDLFASIRDETPVDTGTARDGWTNKDVAKLGDTGSIENLVPYIGWLEFGSDDTAPVGMVRRNIKRVVR